MPLRDGSAKALFRLTNSTKEAFNQKSWLKTGTVTQKGTLALAPLFSCIDPGNTFATAAFAAVVRVKQEAPRCAIFSRLN